MVEDERRDNDEQRKSRYRDIVTGVFGLVLALGAFSITTTDFSSREDVWTALAIFSPAFFFLIAIWQITSELVDRYPANDRLFYTLVTFVLFLTALSPAFLNLLLAEDPDVHRLSATLFPISMAGIFAILSILWLRLAALTRRKGGTPEPDIRDGMIAAAVLAALFLASLLLPYDAKGWSPRTVSWFAAFILPNVLVQLMGRARG
jgi:uncharacterized membrane protein